MVASAIYSAMRGRVRPSLQAMRAEVGRPTFGYSISAVSDGSYEDYKDTYYVDLRSFMPTAPGPYLPAYADRSAIGGVPYDAYDTADHNLQTDLDVYNIVVARYNLDNPSYRQRTVQAIANIELDPVHIFGDNVSTEHYTFHPAFGTDTIGRRIAPDGATATAFDKIGHVGRKNRYWLQDGAYYGRRRPGQGETDGSVKDAPYGVLMDFEIENGDGRGTGYDNEEEYEAAVRSKIYANSYPSGHSAHVFAGALFLMELFPGKADLILRAANQYSPTARSHGITGCRTASWAVWQERPCRLSSAALPTTTVCSWQLALSREAGRRSLPGSRPSPRPASRTVSSYGRDARRPIRTTGCRRSSIPWRAGASMATALRRSTRSIWPRRTNRWS
jgi:hypothetical protein